MPMHRIAVGFTPSPDEITAHGVNPAALTEEAVRFAAHAAIHFAYPGASECHVRVMTCSTRWQWAAALREAGATEGASKEQAIAAWTPGLPTAIIVTDIPTPHEEPGQSERYLN